MLDISETDMNNELLKLNHSCVASVYRASNSFVQFENNS